MCEIERNFALLKGSSCEIELVTVLLPGCKIILSDSWNFGPVIHLHHGPGLEIVSKHSKTMCIMCVCVHVCVCVRHD
jgi:hypothetical protein